MVKIFYFLNCIFYLYHYKDHFLHLFFSDSLTFSFILSVLYWRDISRSTTSEWSDVISLNSAYCFVTLSENLYFFVNFGVKKESYRLNNIAQWQAHLIELFIYHWYQKRQKYWFNHIQKNWIQNFLKNEKVGSENENWFD